MIYFTVAMIFLFSTAFYLMRLFIAHKIELLTKQVSNIKKENEVLKADNLEYLEKIKSLDETIGSLNKELIK